MENLKNKTALVTGSSRGIGKACAISLAKKCGLIFVHYHNRKEDAEDTCQQIENLGGKAMLVQCDVSQTNEIDALINKIKNTGENISILINNAGMVVKKSLEEMDEGSWDIVMDANLKSSFLLTQAFIPSMRENKWGRIINISSHAAITGGSTGPHYAASKAGMNGLTHYYAKMLAGEGITVNSIAPGVIETDMITKDIGVSKPWAPVGRFGKSEEVASIADMLVDNGYMTGQTLVLNGGIYMN